MTNCREIHSILVLPLLRCVRCEGRRRHRPRLFGFVLSSFLMVSAWAGELTDNQVKAVFLFNFASFVTWPALAFNSADSPINYCVVGHPWLRSMIPTVIKDERVNDRTLQFLPNAAESKLTACHILAIGNIGEAQRREVLAQVRAFPVLTVGEDEDFLRAGGMISLMRQGNKIRPMVNMPVLNQAGLTLSAKLMRLIMVFSPSPAGESP